MDNQIIPLCSVLCAHDSSGETCYQDYWRIRERISGRSEEFGETYECKNYNSSQLQKVKGTLTNFQFKESCYQNIQYGAGGPMCTQLW